jgi:hypothetical protein
LWREEKRDFLRHKRGRERNRNRSNIGFYG